MKLVEWTLHHQVVENVLFDREAAATERLAADEHREMPEHAPLLFATATPLACRRELDSLLES